MSMLLHQICFVTDVINDFTSEMMQMWGLHINDLRRVSVEEKSRNYRLDLEWKRRFRLWLTVGLTTI